MITTVENTARVLDVEGWNRDSVATPSRCRRLVGVDGVEWYYGYGAPQPDSDNEADAALVADYWSSLGITVSVERDGQGDPVVFGRGGPVHSLAFVTAPGDYYITGTSVCAAGDAREEYLKISQAR